MNIHKTHTPPPSPTPAPAPQAAPRALPAVSRPSERLAALLASLETRRIDPVMVRYEHPAIVQQAEPAQVATIIFENIETEAIRNLVTELGDPFMPPAAIIGRQQWDAVLNHINAQADRIIRTLAAPGHEAGPAPEHEAGPAPEAEAGSSLGEQIRLFKERTLHISGFTVRSFRSWQGIFQTLHDIWAQIETSGPENVEHLRQYIIAYAQLLVVGREYLRQKITSYDNGHTMSFGTLFSLQHTFMLNREPKLSYYVQQLQEHAIQLNQYLRDHAHTVLEDREQQEQAEEEEHGFLEALHNLFSSG